MRDNAILIAAGDKYSKPHSIATILPAGCTGGTGDDLNVFTT